MASAVVLTLLAAGARASAGDGSPDRPSPSTAASVGLPTRPAINGSSRPPLVPAQEDAVERLAATSHALPGEHSHGHGHLFGPAQEVPLDPSDAARFAPQWAAAVAALPALDTTEEAAAAGYVLSSTPAPGVGVHWVNWQLIAHPFDPARPSMLLFSRVKGVDRLVGFSYWVQADVPPEGFAGPNDQWHTHSGLCVVNGWVEREEVASPSGCVGSWLAGDDLWMLHAWVVPGYRNRWGSFAQSNPTLCPTGAVPDLASCTPDVD